MHSLEMLDVVGVPEFFITTIGKIESAGGGCVRIYGCAEKGGLLVPIYCSIMPALDMAASARKVQEGVREIFNSERIMRAAH